MARILVVSLSHIGDTDTAVRNWMIQLRHPKVSIPLWLAVVFPIGSDESKTVVCSWLWRLQKHPRWTCPVGSAAAFKGLWSPCDFRRSCCVFFFFFWPATFSSSYFPQVGDIIGLSQLGMDLMVSNDITIYIYMRCCDTNIHICK